MKIYISLIAFLIAWFISFTRMNAQDVKFFDLDDVPLGALTPGQIQIKNLCTSTVYIKYSLDSETWKTKTLIAQQSIVASLNINDSKLYVEICNETDATETCDRYPLKPKRRYVLNYSKSGEVILIKAE